MTTAKVLEHASVVPDILAHLPDPHQNGEQHVDRDFLFTIVNTKDPVYFPKQLKSIEKERKEKRMAVGEDVIEVRPEILALLEDFEAPFGKSTKS